MAQQAPSPVPESLTTVTAQFWFNGNCNEAIEFYQNTLGGELLGETIPSPDGNAIWHAMMRIGSSTVMLADAMPGGWETGPAQNTTMSIMLYVDDCDDTWKKATDAGCTVLGPMEDMFWGDRMGKCKDPFGHVWAIASHKWIYTEEEMQQKQQEFLARMATMGGN